MPVTASSNVHWGQLKLTSTTCTQLTSQPKKAVQTQKGNPTPREGDQTPTEQSNVTALSSIFTQHTPKKIKEGEYDK